MNRRHAYLVVLLAVLAAAVGVLVYRSVAPVAHPPAASSSSPAIDSLPPTGSARDSAPPPDLNGPGVIEPAPPIDTVPGYDPEQDDGQVAFKADAQGRLVVNEKTRLDLER